MLLHVSYRPADQLHGYFTTLIVNQIHRERKVFIPLLWQPNQENRTFRSNLKKSRLLKISSFLILKVQYSESGKSQITDL